MELTERKKRILRAIVETYIATAEPVGSKAVAQLAGLDVSTATIRNEMVDLTEMGQLKGRFRISLRQRKSDCKLWRKQRVFRKDKRTIKGLRRRLI